MDRPSLPQVAPTPAEIRAIRKGARMSQAAFARLIRVSPATPGRWERGESRPRGLQLEALLHAIAMVAPASKINQRINAAIAANS